jgi:hypothetical protein
MLCKARHWLQMRVLSRRLKLLTSHKSHSFEDLQRRKTKEDKRLSSFKFLSRSDIIKQLQDVQTRFQKTFATIKYFESQVQDVDTSSSVFKVITEKRLAENVQDSLLQMSQVVYKMVKFQSNSVSDAVVHLQHDKVVTHLSLREVLGVNLPSYLFDQSKGLMENARSHSRQLRTLVQGRRMEDPFVVEAGEVQHSKNLPVGYVVAAGVIGVALLIALFVFNAPASVIILVAIALTVGMAVAMMIMMKQRRAGSHDFHSFEDSQRRVAEVDKRMNSLQTLEYLTEQTENLVNEVSQKVISV